MKIHPSIKNLTMVVYIIIHRATGCCYVGKTIRKLSVRIAQHLRGKKQFVDRIIRAEGKAAFEVGVLEVCNSLYELNEREIFWINYFDCKCPKGFNMTDGGEDCGKNNGRNKPVICIETREKFESISEASRKMGIGMDRISEVCNGKQRTARGLNFVFAHVPPENWKILSPKEKCRPIICVDTGEEFKSITAAAKKFNINKENIGHVCNKQRGTAGGLTFVFADTLPEERKIFISPKKRPVICVDTNEKFESIADAAKMLNLNASGIHAVCSGHRKTVGGLKFIFANPHERKTFIPKFGRSRPVVCIDTGEKFESAADAARKLHICQSSICNVCNGKRKTAGGLNFRFECTN